MLIALLGISIGALVYSISLRINIFQHLADKRFTIVKPVKLMAAATSFLCRLKLFCSR